MYKTLKFVKVILYTISAIILFVIAFIYLIPWEPTVILNDLDDYNEYLSLVEPSKKFMPNLNELTNYYDIRVTYVFYKPSIYGTKTINLVLSYSEEDYIDAKVGILNDFTFLKEPIKRERTNDYILNPIEIKYDNYLVKVIDDQSFMYARYFAMIAFNEEKKEICYMFYWDYYQSLGIIKNEKIFYSILKNEFRF